MLRARSWPSHRMVLVSAVLVACGNGTETRNSDRLGDALNDLRHDAGAPGAILGIRFANGTTRAYAAGVTNLQTRQPVRSTDPFQLGSISKTFTAVVTLQLVQSNRLALDDPLSDFLPDFPRGDEISIRHLLAHTSGLKDFYTYLYFRPDREEMIEQVTRAWSQDEMIDLAGRMGHWFDPGTGWDYSNANYFLAAVIVERITGSPFAQVLRDRLFAPLGMTATWLTLYEPARAEYGMTGYLGPVPGWPHSDMFGDLGPTTPLERSNLEWGAGGIVATAHDQLRFGWALFDGDLLDADLQSVMLDFRSTPALGVRADDTPADLETGYGLGVVTMRRAGYTVMGHGGIFMGHTAGMWFLPDCSVLIATYFNRGFVDQRRVLDRIVPMLSGEPDGGHPCYQSRQ